MLTLTVSPTLLSFQNKQTNSGQQVRDGSLTVTLPRAGATVRRVAELTLAKLGLSGQTLTNFNSWAKTDFLQDVTNQLTQQDVANTLRQATGANVSIKLTIKASLIELLQEFGLTFAQASSGEFSSSAGNNSKGGANSKGSGVTAVNNGGVAKDSESYKKVERQWEGVESTAAVFSTRLIKEAIVRVEYQKLIKSMSKEMLSNFEKGLITEQEAARLANEARNTILEAQRLKSSDLGRAVAKYVKAEGRTLAALQESMVRTESGGNRTVVSEIFILRMTFHLHWV